ncbi:hypothetical protein K491DRAFT_728569 [Lophiostoma macrostomum CBS 122681]|uniref:F-box domain-containing protein n=1 Tax=Lophiostoma macrostomum CBS 122681 TaxID=1314788 RepID=A0A6A6TP70_9PLEO|nr:hypothetical protein K491DRAFT_728569 [Lophiostoma macrostomum CBS 122681]
MSSGPLLMGRSKRLQREIEAITDPSKPPSDGTCYFDRLPDELLLEIGGKLSQSEDTAALRNLSLASRRWRGPAQESLHRSIPLSRSPLFADHECTMCKRPDLRTKVCVLETINVNLSAADSKTPTENETAVNLMKFLCRNPLGGFKLTDPRYTHRPSRLFKRLSICHRYGLLLALVPRLQHLTIIPHDVPEDGKTFSSTILLGWNLNFGHRSVEHWAIRDSAKPRTPALPSLANLRSLTAPDTVSCFFTHLPSLSHTTLTLNSLFEAEAIPAKLLKLLRPNCTITSLRLTCDLSVLDTASWAYRCIPRDFLRTFLPTLHSLKRLRVNIAVEPREEYLVELGNVGGDYEEIVSCIRSESLEELIFDPMPMPAQPDMLPVLSLRHLPSLEVFVAEQPAFVYVGDEVSDYNSGSHAVTQFPEGLEIVGVISSTHAIQRWVKQVVDEKRMGEWKRFREMKLWRWRKGTVCEPDERLRLEKRRKGVWAGANNRALELGEKEAWKKDFVEAKDSVWERLRDEGVEVSVEEEWEW